MDSWDTSPSWTGPQRQVNSTQDFVDEFPATMCWTQNDEVVSHAVPCQSGRTSYRRGSELGTGGFARVYKVLRERDGKLLAGKSSKMIRKLREEAATMRGLKHGHLLAYEGWYEEKGKPETTLLLTEICAGGDLNTYINNGTNGGLSPMEVLRVLHHITGALDYLHQQTMFHSDVKPRNILIRSLRPMNVVLGDCGDVKSEPYLGELLGTASYYSPQMNQFKRHMGPLDDIWALGVTTLGMVAQWPRVVYVQRPGKKGLERKIEEYPRQCWEHVSKLCEMNPQHDIVRLLEHMLVWDEEGRVGARQLEAMVELAMNSSSWDLATDVGIRSPAGFRRVEFW